MKLKNFDTYYNKILDYAKAVGIEISFEKHLNNAYYVSYNKKIYIDPIFTQGCHNPSDLIACLLHELGHFEDDVVQNKKFDKLYAKAAAKIDQEKSLGSPEFNCLMLCEAMAWEKGRVIAQKLKIPLGKWYAIQERDCSVLKRLKMRHMGPSDIVELLSKKFL